MLGLGLLLGAQIRQEAPIQQEGLLLLTDRGHYISGESIHFRAYYRSPEGSSLNEWSRVLYVELITPNGNSLAQSKVSINRAGAKGAIAIPEGLSSGTYYLKAYTRWMQNCGPQAFTYTSLSIYDPYNDKVLPETAGEWEPKEARQLIREVDPYPSDLLECDLDKFSYGTREQVEMELTWSDMDIAADFTLSVVRAGLHGEQTYFNPGCSLSLAESSAILPETQGISMTGQAISGEAGLPAPYATVYVSVLGEKKEFFCNYSDSAGRFYFSFPEYRGDRDLFVSTYHADFDDLELRIDRDFSQDKLILPSESVELGDTLSELITEMSVNAQISQQYYPAKTAESPSDTTVEDKTGQLLFYGHPLSTLYFDDFIRLPKLEEYFIELIPQVAVRKSRGATRLVVLGEHHDLAVFPPLLMIDGVAIFDVEAVLAVSPRLIEKVEIVNAPYIRGNVTFGGIISLISRNKDLGHIDLPSSGLLVNYRMLDQDSADPIQAGPENARLPDVRNTLYWNPGIELDPGGSEKINFRTSDVKGDYDILIRGSDISGKYLEKRIRFTVE